MYNVHILYNLSIITFSGKLHIKSFFSSKRVITTNGCHSPFLERSDIRNPASEIWHQKSDIRDLASEIWHQKSDIKNLASEVWHQKSGIRNLTSEIWHQKSDVRNEIRLCPGAHDPFDPPEK